MTRLLPVLAAVFSVFGSLECRAEPLPAYFHRGTLDFRWKDDAQLAVRSCRVLSYTDLLRVRHDQPLRDVCIFARLTWPDRGVWNGVHIRSTLPIAVPDGGPSDGDLEITLPKVSDTDLVRVWRLESGEAILLRGTFGFWPECWIPDTPHHTTICTPAHAVFMLRGRLYVLRDQSAPHASGKQTGSRPQP